MDRVMAHVVKRAEGCPGINRVVLFGSRARGDAKPRSDYDFAIHADALPHAEWSRWCVETAESAPTLCTVDLVDDRNRTVDTYNETVARELSGRIRDRYLPLFRDLCERLGR